MANKAMASSVLVRPLHLAVVGLGLACLLLLAHAATDDDTAATTTELLHASVLPHDDTTLTLAGRPASSSSSTSPSTTLQDDHAPRRLGVSVVAREDSAAPAPPACSSCSCVRVVVDMREAAVENLVPAPGGITGAAKTRKALLLHALLLLAVPFLPTPLAAVVALSALATPVLSTNATCSVRDREYATCTVYRYLPGGNADRTQPFAGLRKVCSDERAPCSCGQRQGRTFHSYCRVRSLELEDGPAFRVLPGHLPSICDPDAVVRSGGEVCYVELEGWDYREGYYILCPVRKCPARLPFLCCPEFPHGH